MPGASLRYSVLSLTWLPMRLWLRSRCVSVLLAFMCFTKFEAWGQGKRGSGQGGGALLRKIWALVPPSDMARTPSRRGGGINVQQHQQHHQQHQQHQQTGWDMCHSSSFKPRKRKTQYLKKTPFDSKGSWPAPPHVIFEITQTLFSR